MSLSSSAFQVYPTPNLSSSFRPYRLSSSSLCSTPPYSFTSHRRIRSRASTAHSLIVCCASSSSSSEEQPPQPDLEDAEKLSKYLEAKHLKWHQIPFASVSEELDAIDQYEREEEMDENNAWPKFLRAAAYEHWGHPQLALAQYAKTDNAAGLRKVPELWERRAYNCFKLGKVTLADAYYEVAITLLRESVGNELHFVHWFYDNFQDFLPKWNGPLAPLQRGIAKYCVGKPKEARESFLPHVLVDGKDRQHNILWFLAASGKSNENGAITDNEAAVTLDACSDDIDWDPTLRHFASLYTAYGTGDAARVAEVEKYIIHLISTQETIDITTHAYLALYHDAFTGNEAQRDAVIEAVSSLTESPKPNDTENYLFHTLRNRLSEPPTEQAAAAATDVKE